MNIYTKNIYDFDYYAVLPTLDVERQERLASGANALEKRRIAAVGMMLTEHLGAAQIAALRKTATGKPYLPGGPELSMSHGGELAVLMLAQHPCGVDVEPVGRRSTVRVEERVLRPEERASGLAFSWLWTRKEAVMKLDGRGLALDGRSFSVLGTQTELDGRRILLGTQIVQGHFVSWAIEAAEQATAPAKIDNSDHETGDIA